MKIDVGLDQDARVHIGQELGRVLADTYTLYLATHNFHWNVTGPQFQTLHALFMTQYNALWLAMDEVAERIRTLGPKAPGTGSELGRLAAVPEPTGTPSATDMVKFLVDGHETANRTCRQVLALADEHKDQVTVDLLTRRMTEHQKTAWMLRSMLE